MVRRVMRDWTGIVVAGAVAGLLAGLLGWHEAVAITGGVIVGTVAWLLILWRGASRP